MTGLAPAATGPRPRRLYKATLVERLMNRTMADPSGCWLWIGSTNPKGYGHIWDERRRGVYAVHRIVWEHCHGPIPDGLEVDHLCRVRNCVNPDHLEVVDHAANVRRRVRASHCKRGHPLTPENVHIDRRHGGRKCKQCRKARKLEGLTP